MSMDITKLATQTLGRRPAEDAIANIAQSYMQQEHERLYKLIDPMRGIRSFIDEYEEQERRRLREYNELISSPTQRVIEELQRQQQGIDRITEALKPPQALLDVMEASQRLHGQIALVAEPLRDMLERINRQQLMPPPWVTQMESVADYAKKFLESWSEEGEPEEETDWDALDMHLVGVEAAVRHLPAVGTSNGQTRAGMSLAEWAFLITLIGFLIQVLAYLDTRAQGQFARQQAADESDYRERVISTIEALGKCTPTLEMTAYVVGSRPAKVKSAISKGLILGTIHPNQIVLATAHDGRWVKVTYRDHLEKRDIEGWVLKHYLVRQGSAPRSNE